MMWKRIRSWLGFHSPQAAPRPVTPEPADPDLLASANTAERRARIRNALSWILDAPLEAVDDRLRPYLFPHNRDALDQTPADLIRLTRQTLDAEPDLLPAYLFHRNGYVRQTTLDRLSAETMTPFLFMALCLRGNDWVDAVRQTALTKLEALMPDLTATVLGPALPPLIRRMPSWRRVLPTQPPLPAASQPDNLALILSFPAAREAAIDSLLTPRTGPTTRMLLALARYPWLDAHLERLARNAPAPGVRRVAVSALLSGHMRWPVRRKPAGPAQPGQTESVLEHRPLTCQPDRDAIFKLAAHDRAASVRALAADALIADGPDVFDREDWEHLIEDKRQSVRTRMRFFHRKWVEGSLPDYLKDPNAG